MGPFVSLSSFSYQIQRLGGGNEFHLGKWCMLQLAHTNKLFQYNSFIHDSLRPTKICNIG